MRGNLERIKKLEREKSEESRLLPLRGFWCKSKNKQTDMYSSLFTSLLSFLPFLCPTYININIYWIFIYFFGFFSSFCISPSSFSSLRSFLPSVSAVCRIEIYRIPEEEERGLCARVLPLSPSKYLVALDIRERRELYITPLPPPSPSFLTPRTENNGI